MTAPTGDQLQAGGPDGRGPLSDNDPAGGLPCRHCGARWTLHRGDGACPGRRSDGTLWRGSWPVHGLTFSPVDPGGIMLTDEGAAALLRDAQHLGDHHWRALREWDPIQTLPPDIVIGTHRPNLNPYALRLFMDYVAGDWSSE
jgi:hypothetical protein